jgi:hypothetical protein
MDTRLSGAAGLEPYNAPDKRVLQRIRVRYRAHLVDTAGNPAHASTFIRQRLIVLDKDLRRDPRERARILTHERFHFAWVRLGNPRRFLWEAHLKGEIEQRAGGEAGWSAEWRKRELTPSDVEKRTRRWREYCCESFCDTAAWLITGNELELTLARRYREGRKAWFAASHIIGVKR